MVLVKYRNGKIDILSKKVSEIGKITGLMFRSRSTKNLFFDFKKSSRIKLYSIFVFFPFLVLWLNKKNNVVDFRIVNPFSLSVYTKKRFFSLIEIPLNEKNEKIVKFFVGKRKI